MVIKKSTSKTVTKKKKPSSEKRLITSEKKRLLNKSFKSKASSVLRSLEESLKAKDNEKVLGNLNAVFSVMDKGVKRGVFKLNKASRVKSRANEKVSSLLSNK